MTTALYVSGWIVFVVLLAAAYRGGSKLAGRTTRASGVPPQKPLRCECRRHAFPSPLCEIHGYRQ
jgi:hypothetical protein